MIIRRGDERGYEDHGWLRSYHTFSFANYFDPDHMGFRYLRVLNEDRVAPASGFPAHSHSDMEIITYVLAGELAHRDSMGNTEIIHAGEVQRMSAGTGVTHSEYNNSEDRWVHFFQIWILPQRRGTAPSYEQAVFPVEERYGTLRLIASPDGRDGSITVRQDVSLYGGLLADNQRLSHELSKGRFAWLQVASGTVELNGVKLEAGDAAAVGEPGALDMHGWRSSEILLFETG